MKVLLTGASGFLGKHYLDTLLKSGHTVVGTVRTDAKAKQLLSDYPGFGDKLPTSIVADMAAPGAFDQVIVSDPPFDAVLHSASPFHYHAEDAKRDMIDPAVNGTTEILKAVKRFAPSVRRVVITSSFAAVLNMAEYIPVYTEDMWNPITMEQSLSGGLATYVGSKKFAERAAWDFVNTEKPGFILSTVNPTLIFSPVTNGLKSLADVNTSNETFRDMIQGKMKDEIAPYQMQWVDVRDVALTHVRALEVPEAQAAGRRFLCSAGPYNNHQLASIIKDKFPQLADKFPEKIEVPEMQSFKIDTTGVNETLGVPFRSLEESVVDTVRSLLAVGS